MLLISAVFVSGAIITPVLDKLVRVPFDLDNRQASLFLLVNAAAHLFGPLIGLISDRTGRRIPFLMIGLVGSGVLLSLYPWITSYNLLLLVRFFEGIFWIGALTLLFSRAIDITPSDLRGKAMAFVSLALPMAYLSAPLLAAVLGDRHLELMFLLVGGFIVICGLSLTREWKNEGSICHQTPKLAELLSLLKREPRLMLPILFGFIDKITIGLIAMLSLILADLFLITEILTISIIVAVFWIGYLAGLIPTGRLTGRGWTYSLLFGGSALYGSAMILMGVAPLGMFIFLIALAGFMSAVMFIPSLVLVGQFTTTRDRGTAMGLYNFFGTIGIMTGFTVMGILSSISYQLAFTIAGTLEIIAALIGFLFLRFGLLNPTPKLNFSGDEAFEKLPSEKLQPGDSASGAISPPPVTARSSNG